MPQPIRDLEEPLITPYGEQDAGVGPSGRRAVVNTFWGSVSNLTKAVLGAGMMTLPKACAILGSWLGTLVLCMVATLTWASISRGLVHPASGASTDKHGRTTHGSDADDSEESGSEKRYASSYSCLIRSNFGDHATKVFNILIIANALGFAVMYMDICADVLLGSDTAPGILPDALAAFGASPALASWVLYRPLFLAVFMGLIVTPLCLRRDISSLSPLNVLGLASLLALGLSAVWLAAAAWAQGQGHLPPAWPSSWPSSSAAPGTGSAAAGLISVLCTLPAVMAADGCHMNVFPMASMLKPYTRRAMDQVVAITMTIITLYYLLIAFSAYAAFGEGLEEDVLKNLNAPAMTPLIGALQAQLVAYGVRVGYVISLLGSAAINTFPLRDTLADLLTRDAATKAMVLDTYFPHMTLGALLVAYLVAVMLPSIWTVIGLVGGISLTGVSFIFPALLMLRTDKSTGWQRAGICLCAAILMVIGTSIFTNTVVVPFLPGGSGAAHSEGGDNAAAMLARGAMAPLALHYGSASADL
mmetsp:Transcript_12278/g.26484  ORF Transcript_12278/g.26484 Transcript_12278/m.26484 type:complete len:530 (+) Transcript_12278:141-1730(+)